MERGRKSLDWWLTSISCLVEVVECDGMRGGSDADMFLAPALNLVCTITPLLLPLPLMTLICSLIFLLLPRCCTPHWYSPHPAPTLAEITPPPTIHPSICYFYNKHPWCLAPSLPVHRSRTLKGRKAQRLKEKNPCLSKQDQKFTRASGKMPLKCLNLPLKYSCWGLSYSWKIQNS